MAEQTYFTLITEKGLALFAQATALEEPVKLKTFAIGDGNGTLPTPSASQIALVNEVRRGAINTITIDKDNPNHIVIQHVIPPDEGGFYIREIGVFDENDQLIAIGNCPPTYKPVLSEGSGRTQVINMIIVVENTANIELKIDASTVLATREYVDQQITICGKTAQTTANNAQSTANAALPKAGGTMTGEIISTSAQNYRMIDNNRGFFFRLDERCFYIMRTKENDPTGGWDTFRPIMISTVDDIVYIAGTSFAGGVMNGTATNSQKLDGKELSYFAPSADAVLKSNLLQTTGTATNNTMSQNAITQNIDKRALQSTLDNLSIGRNYCPFMTLNSYEDWGELQVGGSWLVRGASYGVNDAGAYYYCTCIGKREQGRDDPGLFILARIDDSAGITPYFLSGATSSSGTRYMKKYLIGVTLT